MRQLKIDKSITSRTSDALSKYLADIKKTKELSAEEEVELAAKVREGDEKALERMICANLKFVVSIKRKICRNEIYFLILQSK